MQDKIAILWQMAIMQMDQMMMTTRNFLDQMIIMMMPQIETVTKTKMILTFWLNDVIKNIYADFNYNLNYKYSVSFFNKGKYIIYFKSTYQY